MSIFDSLVGNSNSNTYGDKEIAEDTLKDSKFLSNVLLKALEETLNPELRKLLHTELTNSINEQHALSDMMTAKSWYFSSDNPDELTKNDIAQSNDMLSSKK